MHNRLIKQKIERTFKLNCLINYEIKFYSKKWSMLQIENKEYLIYIKKFETKSIKMIKNYINQNDNKYCNRKTLKTATLKSFMTDMHFWNLILLFLQWTSNSMWKYHILDKHNSSSKYLLIIYVKIKVLSSKKIRINHSIKVTTMKQSVQNYLNYFKTYFISSNLFLYSLLQTIKLSYYIIFNTFNRYVILLYMYKYIKHFQSNSITLSIQEMKSS